MSALAIQVPAVLTRTANTKVYPPRVTNLEGLFFLGGTLTDSVINRSPLPNKANALAVGAPAAAADGLTLQYNSAYLDTLIAEVDSMTLIAWHVNADAQFAAISNAWTTRQGGTANSYGLTLASYGGTAGVNRIRSADMGVRAVGATSTNGSVIKSSSGPTGISSAFVTRAGRFSTTQVRHNNLTAGSATTTTAISGGNERDKASGTLKLGTQNVGGLPDAFKMAGAAIYSAELSDQELADFYTWLKAYELAMRSLAV